MVSKTLPYRHCSTAPPPPPRHHDPEIASARRSTRPDARCGLRRRCQGHLLYVNASFERIFGYTPDEVLGRRIFELVHPDDRAATVQQAAHVTAGELQRHFRNRYIHKHGHSVDIQWSARWLPGHGVRIGVAHEVTELRHAERELE